MRKLPLIAGAVLCFVVPVLAQQQAAHETVEEQQVNYAHQLMVGSNDSVDRRSPIIP